MPRGDAEPTAPLLLCPVVANLNSDLGSAKEDNELFRGIVSDATLAWYTEVEQLLEPVADVDLDPLPEAVWAKCAAVANPLATLAELDLLGQPKCYAALQHHVLRQIGTGRTTVEQLAELCEAAEAQA